MTRAVGIAGYALLAVVIVGYELTGLVWRRTPTLGDALTLVTRSRAGRWLLLAGWLWLGWHLFVRASWR